MKTKLVKVLKILKFSFGFHNQGNTNPLMLSKLALQILSYFQNKKTKRNTTIVEMHFPFLFLVYMPCFYDINYL